ncbi:hypothetical protein RUM44_004706 [Polyplax serrata]|uniref:Mitogen-activated protein kinase-binding protein 1 n=1 Tax=Polyplax serrata TaxID=468196 RepID=A0ABR1B5C0_POLSC
MDVLTRRLVLLGCSVRGKTGPKVRYSWSYLLVDDEEETHVKLERVLGLTVGSNSALDCDPLSDLIAYPAGCTVVLFNSKKNKESHILNTSRKTITCLAFGSGGKYLATGECGHAPSLRVWSVQDGVQMAEFQGHKYGINCVAFSPNNKYVVSIGSQHDMIVNVWDWKNNVKVASNKVSTKVKAVSFAENGKYFVTVGMRNVKFWYLEHTRSTKYNDPVPLTGRSAILGEQRDNYFCDVACGRGKMGDSTYSITKSGLLCEFSVRRMLDKWVELRTKSANCMTVGENYIFVGCADGIIRCFSPMTLEFLVTLPRTHYLGVDVALGLNISHLLTHPPDAKYPDAIALAYDETNKKLTCVYNDHSLYVWDVREIRRVGKSHSFLYHSACIWGVEIYPEVETKDQLPVPAGSFITCSSDDTIRVWNLNNLGNNNATAYRRNIYSNELLKVLYIDKNLTYLKDLDLTISSSEKTDTSYDGKNGVRSVRISPDGQHLASGDREGNIRIHELTNLQQMVIIEAHDAEVLCLEYTKESNENLLASASRDRLIHVFDVSKGYECTQTLDDHSSSITSVRFLNSRGQLQMISCSADKSIIFRQFHPASAGGSKQFLRDHNVAGKTTLYDMEIDCSQKHILTACQDRNIRVYNVISGKHSKTFKGSMGEDGTLIKVSLDNSGIYVATSCTDKSLSIYDYYSGECMATMLGHSELVTGLRFTNDCKRLISASGDGCIFIWKLPRDMTVTMQARLDQQAVRKGKRTMSLNIGLNMNDGPELVSDEEPEAYEADRNANIDKEAFKLSVGQLPAWARREIEDSGKGTKVALEANDNSEQPIHTGYSVIKINKPPQGRWAQRIENNEIMIATFSPDKQKNVNESNSKDSSLESQMERHYEERKMKEMQGGEGVEFDGDAEDSDVEAETHYYPISVDSNSSEYTVNANNVEELRRSARKYKKQQLKKNRPNSLNLEPLSALSNPATSVSGSQDSDDDDLEDISSETETPSIERSLGFGMTAISTESLDLFGQRETYFKNNFESLNTDNSEGRKDVSGKSITSQYLVRNTAVVNAAQHTKSEIEKMKKREELKKRLEDTRRTLKISGMSPSPLKASQSICDLSRYSDRSRNSSGRNCQPAKGKSHKAVNLLTIFSYPTNLKTDLNKDEHRSLNGPRNSVVHAEDFDRVDGHRSKSVKSNFHSGFPPAFSVDVGSTGEPLPKSEMVFSNVNKSKSISDDFKRGIGLVECNSGFVPENVTENFSLPESPVRESKSLSEHRHSLTDVECLRGNRFSLYSHVSEKKKRTENQKMKEMLLLAHDQIGQEYCNINFEDKQSVKKYLEEEEENLSGSDQEFSSDSLESESIGGKCPRRCVSDYQIFTKSNRNLSLCSAKNTDDFSDTDISGITSLQGSGDLLEMQDRDQILERQQSLFRHSSASLIFGESIRRSTESVYPDGAASKLNKSVENVGCVDDLKSLRGLKKQPAEAKKGDAFFVEFSGSPRAHKPVLRSHTVPLKGKPEKTVVREESEGRKVRPPPTPPKPVIADLKKRQKGPFGRRLSVNYGQPVLPNKVFQDENLDDDEGLRRAISLSDLSAAPALQSNSSQGKSPAKAGNSNGYNNSRTNLRSPSSMVRCSSVGVLNRIDPAADSMPPPDSKKFGVGKGLMRPTISSQNKIATSGSKVQNSGLTKRRGTAFSSVNLTSVGVNDDSSSEETGFNRGKYVSDKNNVDSNQRRPSNLGRYGSLKDLSHRAKEVTQRLTSATSNAKKNKIQEPEKQTRIDVAAAPITKQLCSSVTTQLSQDIDNLILLHKRLTLEADGSQNRSHLEQMTEDLEKLAVETQQKLNALTSKLKNNNSMIRNQLSTNSSNFLGNNLGLMTHNNVTSAPTTFVSNANNPNLMTNVDMSRISEMLISVVQQYTENQQNNQKS